MVRCVCVFAGLQFENQGRLAGAIGLYRQAIKLHPGLDRGIVCLDSEEAEREGQRDAERNAGDMEGDVHVDKPKCISRRTWDAAKQAAAADASSTSGTRRGSAKGQGDAAAASAGSAPEASEHSPIMKVPEHLLGKIVTFLDTYAVAK